MRASYVTAGGGSSTANGIDEACGRARGGRDEARRCDVDAVDEEELGPGEIELGL